jgi:multiple sugar transport system permease protein
MSVQEETTTTRPDAALSTTTGPPTPERSARTSLARTRNRAAWLFASPALLVILLVTVFPVIYSVVLSFARVTIDYDGFQVES